MPDSDSLQHDRIKADHCKRLGLEPEATRREVETGYWRIARELRGQAAMAPYNEAYEALTTRDRSRDEPAAAPAATPTAVEEQKEPPAARPPSKLNWPST